MNEPIKMKKRIERLTFESIANGAAMKEADHLLLKIQEDIRDPTKKAKFNRELTVKIKVVVNEVRDIEEIEFHVTPKLAPYVPEDCRSYFDDDF